jgi:hypothetical protein
VFKTPLRRVGGFFDLDEPQSGRDFTGGNGQFLDRAGGIKHDEARNLIASKLSGGSIGVRLAAAKALSKHRHQNSANALGQALGANRNEKAVLRGIIEALGDLDMCACIQPLCGMLDPDYPDLAQDALKALAKIGCPEAVPALVKLLKDAEKEAKEPDKLPPAAGGPQMRPPGAPPGVNVRPGGGSNPGKDKKLAGLVKPIADCLAKITGSTYNTAKDYETWFNNLGGISKLVQVFLCQETGQTFDVYPGKSKKCTLTEKKGHADDFVKHRR